MEKVDYPRAPLSIASHTVYAWNIRLATQRLPLPGFRCSPTCSGCLWHAALRTKVSK